MMLKDMKGIILKVVGLIVCFTVICGVVYPFIVTAITNLCFPNQATGSMIEINGKTYGSSLLAQEFTTDEYLWGRIMNLDTTTYIDTDGKPLFYAYPSNISPTSEEFEKLVADRVERIKSSNPDATVEEIPVDLVTCSGSGLDPDISVNAATYQIPRIAKARGIEESEVENIIKKYTTHRLLGIFGEETVNVLKVNLALDGIFN